MPVLKHTFEDICLGVTYLSDFKNAPEDYLKKVELAIYKTSSSFYKKNFFMIHTVSGMDFEDLHSITKSLTLAYTSVSILFNKKYYDRFVIAHQLRYNTTNLPSEKETTKVDINNLMNFLSQKLCYFLKHLKKQVRKFHVSDMQFQYLEFNEKNKIKNILSQEEFNKLSVTKEGNEYTDTVTGRVFVKQEKNPEPTLFTDLRKYRSNTGSTEDSYTKDLFVETNNIDYSNVYSDSSNPEELIMRYESEKEMDKKYESFYSLSNQKKRDKLNIFIKNNKNNESLKNELKIARKILKNKVY
jgi:hypothetical protein